VRKANCRSCNAAIVWLNNVSNGKANPVDVEPSDKGNIRIVNGKKAEYLSNEDAEAARGRGEKLHLSHFATCPDAKSHRKPKS
jgi:hypothetical protein